MEGGPGTCSFLIESLLHIYYFTSITKIMSMFSFPQDIHSMFIYALTIHETLEGYYYTISFKVKYKSHKPIRRKRVRQQLRLHRKSLNVQLLCMLFSRFQWSCQSAPTRMEGSAGNVNHTGLWCFGVAVFLLFVFFFQAKSCFSFSNMPHFMFFLVFCILYLA